MYLIEYPYRPKAKYFGYVEMSYRNPDDGRKRLYLSQHVYASSIPRMKRNLRDMFNLFPRPEVFQTEFYIFEKRTHVIIWRGFCNHLDRKIKWIAQINP